MISLTFLYDEYIDRPKSSEQKKPIWVYSSSPHKRGRNNYRDKTGKKWNTVEFFRAHLAVI